MNCLIVDDEYLAQDLLENYLSRMPEMNLIGKCSNAMETISALNQNNIDLIFLDIQMPDLTGLELLRTLKDRPAVIFTTAYSEYALESYDLDVVDYLLKPISFTRFVQAVNKVSGRIPPPGEAVNPDTLEKIAEDTNPWIFVKTNYKNVKVRFEDILFVQGLREYVSIHTSKGRIVTLDSMKNLEENLPTNKFIRIHKSYIVSILAIEAIDGNSIEIGGKSLPVGKTYKEEVWKVIKG